MCLADDNNITCFYQDTDSIHMYEDEVQPLAELYEKKYNTPLIGKKLGQFHSDFEFEGMKDIRSVGLITLGKNLTLTSYKAPTKTATRKTHTTSGSRVLAQQPSKTTLELNEKSMLIMMNGNYINGCTVER